MTLKSHIKLFFSGLLGIPAIASDHDYKINYKITNQPYNHHKNNTVTHNFTPLYVLIHAIVTQVSTSFNHRNQK